MSVIHSPTHCSRPKTTPLTQEITEDPQTPDLQLYLSGEEDYTAVPEEEVLGTSDSDDLGIFVKKQAASIISIITEGKSVTKSNKLRIVELCHQLIKKSNTTPAAPINSPSAGSPCDNNDTIKELIEKGIETIKNTIQTEVSKARTVLLHTQSQTDKHPEIGPRPRKANATTRPIPAPTFRPALIISPKGEGTSPEDTLQEWRNSVSLTDTNFSPASVRYASKNRIIAEFDKDDHLEVALKKIKGDCNVTARPAPALKPMIILKGISIDIPQETLTDIVCKQNDSIKDNLDNWDDIKFKFLQGNRNSKFCNAVFMVTPSIWKSVIEVGHVNINHQRVHAEDYIPLLQCFKCLQFGHTRRHCSSDKIACSHCSSQEHDFKNCPVKSDLGKTSCHNCLRFNAKHNITNKNSAHSATSRNCPRLIHMKSRTRSRINYGN